MPEPRYYTRGFLPHLNVPEATQFLTWRLADAIPPVTWRQVLEETIDLPGEEQRRERARRAEVLLDEGLGCAYLRQPLVALAAQEALFFGHGKRYRLRAYAVMPTHVHALLSLAEAEALEDVTRTIKSFSAREANRLLGRSGRFWQVESFDRLIRTSEQLDRTIAYIEWNPVKARLVADPKHYPYSSANPENVERLLAAE